MLNYVIFKLCLFVQISLANLPTVPRQHQSSIASLLTQRHLQLHLHRHRHRPHPRHLHLHFHFHFQLSSMLIPISVASLAFLALSKRCDDNNDDDDDNNDENDVGDDDDDNRNETDENENDGNDVGNVSSACEKSSF